MSIRDEIREILAEGRTRTTAQLAEALGKPIKVVAMQLGGMHDAVAAGEGPGAVWRLDPTAVPAPSVRRAKAATAPAAEPAEPPAAMPFDAALWLDGQVVIYGAAIANGRVHLTSEQARQLRSLLAAMPEAA
jgi:ABC-type uncharacterized transport system permease subunit